MPLRHTVITGQTQEAGKTTALEAMVARSGRRALAFVTKRGEGSFRGARLVPPYFREQTDWRYVTAILEAAEEQRFKFERPWIMRAVKGCRTLEEVQRNVRKLQAEAKKGMDQDMYMVLDAYLQDLVPQIKRVRWAPKVELGPGVSAMDLRDLSEAMQHLVIRSAVEWVLEKEEGVLLLVPEAWKFIPEGRGTPVKLAAEGFIRQGAALGNYLWLDSQDVVGVEKRILKSCPVWILGVQRELNEVKRTLEQVHGSPKPKPAEVARLQLGQFYVCHGDVMTKAYAWPAWMGEAEAVAIAEGRTPVSSAHPAKEAKVDEQEAKALREKNQALTIEVTQLRGELRDALRRLEKIGRGDDPSVSVAIAPGAGYDKPREAASGPQFHPAYATPFPGACDVVHLEDYYQSIKRRLADEAPQLLQILAERPEIEVAIRREVVRVDGKSLKGRVAKLVAEGFFDEGRLQSHVLYELERYGIGVSDKKNLPREIGSLVEMGFLTIEDGADSKGRARKAYKAVPGMKVNLVEGDA